jgi:hypothetical protein
MNEKLILSCCLINNYTVRGQAVHLSVLTLGRFRHLSDLSQGRIIKLPKVYAAHPIISGQHLTYLLVGLLYICL